MSYDRYEQKYSVQRMWLMGKGKLTRYHGSGDLCTFSKVRLTAFKEMEPGEAKQQGKKVE